MKVLVGLLLVSLATTGHAQLQCFVCENCPDPFDGSLHTQQPCTLIPGPPVTPPAGPTTPLPPLPPGPDDPIMTPPGLPTTTLAPGPIPPGPVPPPGPDPPAPVPPPGPDTPIITPPPLNRRRRQVNMTPRCFVLTHGGATRRGCAMHGTDHLETCRTLNAGIQPNECRVCDWNGCNSASGLSLSIASLLAALLIALRLF